MLKLTVKRTKWFTVPQDESGDSRIEIVNLKPGQIADIESKVNSVVGKQRGDEFETEIGFDLARRTKEFTKRVVVDWEGFCGKDSKPLKCNDKNKLAILSEFEWFGTFVEECRVEYAEELELEQEEVEKN